MSQNIGRFEVKLRGYLNTSSRLFQTQTSSVSLSPWVIVDLDHVP